MAAPLGDQRIRPDGVDDDARQGVASDLGPLFQNHDAEVGLELLWADRSREASGPASITTTSNSIASRAGASYAAARAVALGHVCLSLARRAAPVRIGWRAKETQRLCRPNLEVPATWDDDRRLSSSDIIDERSAVVPSTPMSDEPCIIGSQEAQRPAVRHACRRESLSHCMMRGAPTSAPDGSRPFSWSRFAIVPSACILAMPSSIATPSSLLPLV